MVRATCVVGWAASAVVAPSTLAGQAPSGSGLDMVEAALDSGRVELARAELTSWFAENEAAVDKSTLARARFLRGRMTADADSAEIDYIWVAIEGGRDYAPRAWLKLAQLRLVRGEAARASTDLERLRADYPSTPLLAESWLWSGFTRETAGDQKGACEAWGRARDLATGPGDESVREQAELALDACAATAGRFTIQLGAFRERGPATALQREIEAAGADVRIEEPVANDGWYRVRTGRFASRSLAEEQARNLTARGFEAIVVSLSP